MILLYLLSAGIIGTCHPHNLQKTYLKAELKTKYPFKEHSQEANPFALRGCGLCVCVGGGVSLSDSAGHRYLPEAELAIEVLIHLFDHTLQAQVGLGSPQPLHHELQLHQVDKTIPSSVIPARSEEARSGQNNTRCFSRSVTLLALATEK